MTLPDPEAFLRFLLAGSAHATVLAILVLLLQKIPRLPARWRFALWFLVLIPLTPIPLPATPFSLLNFLPRQESVSSSLSLSSSSSVPAPSLAPSPDQPALKPIPLPAPAMETNADQSDARAPLPAPATRPTSLPALLTLHLVIAALILLRQFLATLALRRIIARATPATDSALLQLLTSAKSVLNLHRKNLPLLLTDDLPSPALAGILKPRLLLPRHLLATLTFTDLHFIFLHECAHLKRRDVLLNHYLAFLSALHWFNPFLWILLPRIKADRELAADELVLHHVETPRAYGETILKLLTTTPFVNPAPSAVAILEPNAKRFLKRRFQMIAQHNPTPRWLTAPALATLLALAALTLTTPINTAAETIAATPPIPATTQATSPAPDLSPDALLQREIQKWKGYKESITGQSPDDKLMQDDCNRVLAYLEKYVGKPYPPRTEPGPGGSMRGADPMMGAGMSLEERMQARRQTSADHTVAAHRRILQRVNTTLLLQADKKPFAFVLKDLQEQVYNALLIDYLNENADPRTQIVGIYTTHTVFVDWKSLSAAGIHPDTPVTVDIKKTSDYGAITNALTNTLQEILNKITAPDAKVFAGLTGRGITITVHTRVTYNIRDLLAPVPSRKAGGLSIPGNPDDLIKAIKTSVSPHWWLTNPRESNIIQFKGIMTITTTPEIHEGIQNLLDTLRRADKEDAAAASRSSSADLIADTLADGIHANAIAMYARELRNAGSQIQQHLKDGKSNTHPTVVELRQKQTDLEAKLEQLRKRTAASNPIRPAPRAGEDGEYYVMGDVQRPGVYTLTKRRITLKQALAAAALDIAAAENINVTVVRREDNDSESKFTANFKSILDGTEPDAFLQPNDVLNVKLTPKPTPQPATRKVEF